MTTERTFISQAEVLVAAQELAARQPELQGLKFWGIPRGGAPAALALAYALRGKVVANPQVADVIVDDIYDSGKTFERFAHHNKPMVALFDKRLERWKGKWLVLPWEHADGKDQSADDIVTRLLQFIGEDPTREGLLETPARVLKAWSEWASGYRQDPKAILKCFEDGAKGVNELVVVHNIPIVSKCEHHLADVVGIAHVGYIPNGKIVGLSKLPRLVNCFAHRLQVQERLTNQIADALVEHVAPLGVGVLIRAAHHCMSTRGVRIHGSSTSTSAMRGALLDKPEARAEFMSLCRMAERGER